MFMKVLCCVCVGLLPFAGLAQEAAEEKPVLAVSLVAAEERAHVRTLAAEGEVAAREMAAVNAQVAGVALGKLYVNVGDWVKEGQVLAEFDAALIRHELAQAQAAVARATAALKLARSQAARAQRLVKDKAISQSDADQLAGGEAEARAALDGAVAARDAAQLRLDYAQVKAPVGGVVVERAATLGMTANVGLPLFSLLVDGALEWRAQVAPEEVVQIARGTKVQVRLGGRLLHGRVVRFAPVADARSRQVTVFAAMEGDAALRAGMFVRGEFLLDEVKVRVVPVSALVREDGYDYVVLVDGQGRAKRQLLSLGERLDGWVVVRDGLPEGARMVARGGSFLQDGDVVRVEEGQ